MPFSPGSGDDACPSGGSRRRPGASAGHDRRTGPAPRSDTSGNPARDERPTPSVLRFASAAALAECAFFAVIIPLLPRLVDEFGFSTSAAGLLVAAYPAGMALSAYPAARLVIRFGARPAALGGLGVLALAGLWFGLASTSSELLAARFLQGIGAATTWAGALTWLLGTTPRAAQGQALGRVFGTSFIGLMLAPAIGAGGELVDVRGLFLGIAAALAVLAGRGLSLPPSPPVATSAGGARRSSPLERRGAFLGICLVFVVGVVSGALEVIGPLRMHELGAGTVFIAATFLLAYAPQPLLSPLLGRWADRRGPARPVLVGLVGVGVLSGCLALVSALPLVVAFAVWTPAAVLASHGGGESNAGQAHAMAYVNAAWAVGAASGSVALAGVAQDHGYATAFAVCALVAAISAALTVAGTAETRTQHT